MKVLYITNFPSPYKVDFLNKLGKTFDLTVLFDEAIEEQTDREKEWFYTDYKNFKPVFLKRTKLIKNKHICFEVTKYLNQTYDVIILANYSSLTGMYAINYMKRKNIKFVLTADGGLFKDGKGIKEKIKTHLISSANWWISSGEVTDSYFIFYGAKQNKIYRYPFTSLLETDILKKPVTNKEKIVLREKLNMKEEKIIISIGQFIHRKGFDVLIKASKNLDKNIGIYMVGGQAPQKYLDLKEKYNLKNVHFRDFVSKEKIIEYYKAADLFVLPTREDIWGLVINEAMGFALPVITTNKCVAGLELIVDDINGYIVDVDNIKQLEESINKIIKNDVLSKKMSLENLNKIQDYTIEQMTKTHIEIINAISKDV